MIRYIGTMSCVLLIACGGKDGEPSDTGPGTAPVTGCQNEITETFPVDQSADVYYRTTVEFTLETVAGSETILVSQGGTAVPGQTTTVDNRIVFTPDAPLDPSTTYDVTLEWECGPTNVSWTTSDVGSPVDETSLVGNTYTVDLASGRFVEPPGVGSLIQQQVDQEILIGVSDVANGQIQMLGALADSMGMQEMCTPTIDFPVADFSENPFFSVGPDDVTLNVEGFEITIADLVVSGAFSPDAGSLEGAILAGFIDTRLLLDLVGGTEDGDVCELVATFGVSCENCSDGQPYCLSVYVDSMSAKLAAGVTLMPMTQEQIDADPMCAETTAR